jgi:hypothetical protein
MRFQEIVDEAGTLGKLGSAIGQAAKNFKQGTEKWQGTGIFGGPKNFGGPSQADDSTPSVLKSVDPKELKQILAAALQGKQLDGKLLQVAQSLEQKL